MSIAQLYFYYIYTPQSIELTYLTLIFCFFLTKSNVSLFYIFASVLWQYISPVFFIYYFNTHSYELIVSLCFTLYNHL